MKINFRHMVYALSDALDLVGVDDFAHGKRVGIMASECAKHMGMNESDVLFLFNLGLLHDIGVSSTHVHKCLIDEFDWEESQIHAEVGHNLLINFAPLSRMALPIRYHHTHWDRLIQLAVHPDIAKQANLIFLVDRVDALAAPYSASNTVLQHKDEIREKIESRAHTYFSPELVEIFLNVSNSEAFWLLLEAHSVQTYLRDALWNDETYQATMDHLKHLAFIFSRIVDAKSPFTAIHSLGVARLSCFLAEKMGVSEENCEKLEIAGMLHDLGKLRIPDEILDKPTALDPNERLIIKAHSFETFQILHKIRGFEDIAIWAAYHHEEPDGSGYPFRIKNESMPLEARILRVADIFQAMIEDRPYRKRLNPHEAMTTLNQLADQGKVDAEVVAAIKIWINEIMQIAQSD